MALARQVAARHSAPHREVLRARLTLLLAENPGLSHMEVAARTGLSPKTVQKWRRRWHEHGWSLTDAPRPGRPTMHHPASACSGQSLGR
jgi:transposase